MKVIIDIRNCIGEDLRTDLHKLETPLGKLNIESLAPVEDEGEINPLDDKASCASGSGSDAGSESEHGDPPPVIWGRMVGYHRAAWALQVVPRTLAAAAREHHSRVCGCPRGGL